MATNRPTGFGLSRELAEKNAAKYSVDDEVSERWIKPQKWKKTNILNVNCWYMQTESPI